MRRLGRGGREAGGVGRACADAAEGPMEFVGEKVGDNSKKAVITYPFVPNPAGKGVFPALETPFPAQSARSAGTSAPFPAGNAPLAGTGAPISAGKAPSAGTGGVIWNFRVALST